MKVLYFLVLLFPIHLDNGMANLSVELEQSVEKHNVDVVDNPSLDIHEVQLNNTEVQIPSRIRRASAILALAFLAVLLACTFHAVYTRKHRENVVKELEQKLAKFRKFVKEKKELTQGQKTTLKEMQEKVKEFLEADTEKALEFANDMRNLLMEFFINGLKNQEQEQEYEQKLVCDEVKTKIEFLDLFDSHFFDDNNHSHRLKYLDEKGKWVGRAGRMIWMRFM